MFPKLKYHQFRQDVYRRKREYILSCVLHNLIMKTMNY